MEPLALAAASLDTDDATAYRGHVDKVDPARGIEGWAITLPDIALPARLELVAGSEVIAACAADQPRDDLTRRLGGEAKGGFQFPPEVFARLAALPVSLADTRPAVRFAGTRIALPAAQPLPRIGEIGQHFRSRSRPPAGGAPSVHRLLETLRQQAEPLARLPLRPLPEQARGCLETVSVDPAGYVWLGGWIERGLPLDFAALVIDRQKYPAAVTATSYERPDLPPSAVGFLGVAACDWQPTAASQPLVFFGTEGEYHLNSIHPLRCLPMAATAEQFETVRHQGAPGRIEALRSILASPESWVPTNTRLLGVPFLAAVDTVLVVPHFGCFVEGWVLSPLKQVDTLRLKIGNRVLSSDRNAFYSKPRPDLAELLPKGAMAAERAGFVAVFPGEISGSLGDPRLKAVFADGTSATLAIEPESLRQLGRSARLDEVQALYPALAAEQFFPAFARAVRLAERQAAGPCVAFALARCDGAAVFALPDDRSDTFLLFEQLAHRRRLGLPLPPLALVASRSAQRGAVVERFEDLRRNAEAPASLFFVDDAAFALAALPAILKVLQLRRFLFVAPHVVLTEAGWRAAEESLAVASDRLDFFEIGGETAADPDWGLPYSAECFAWSREPFGAWNANALPCAGGLYRDNGLLAAADEHVLHGEAARRSRPRLPSPLLSSINGSTLSREAAPHV